MVTRPARRNHPARVHRTLLWGGLLLSLILAPVITLAQAVASAPTGSAEAGAPATAAGVQHLPALNAAATGHDRCDTDSRNCCQGCDCPEHASCSSHCMNHVPACAILTPPLRMTAGDSLAPVTPLTIVRSYFSPLPLRPPRHC